MEGNLEREDDCEIEDGDKKESKTEKSWSMSGNIIHRHHEELRLKRYDSDIETFLIPLKYVDVMKQTQTNINSRNTRGELCSERATPKTKKGYTAVFTEQGPGASASQMAAANLLDTISKLLGVAGEPQVTQFQRTLKSK